MLLQGRPPDGLLNHHSRPLRRRLRRDTIRPERHPELVLELLCRRQQWRGTNHRHNDISLINVKRHVKSLKRRQ